ncbi:chromatin assembly factor 1 subunit A-domain-containing protein [Melanogaster broomeanus]|nr:chromatin assembly factor 1 subunit A-domain-containing protein [Melanogaster broomeanus]
MANRNTIAELRNGKVIFKQKPISFEKASETMQEIVKFREMLDQRVQNQDQPLASVPDEHKPLIVKLAQESDKGVIALAKQIRSILLPGQGEVEDSHHANMESILPLPAVEHALKMVMTRTNYGLDGALGQKLPAAVCVWRWEVQDAYKDWLPKSARENAEARAAERIEASKRLRAAFENLPQAERDAILDPKGAVRLPVKDTNTSEAITDSAKGEVNPVEDPAQRDLFTIAADCKVRSIRQLQQAENVAPKGRPKKGPDPEKSAKVKEKEEKRAAKVEKEKKQKEAQDKSRSMMSNTAGGPSATESEFQRTFKPFVLKKDAELAPSNWFLESKKQASRKRSTGVTHTEAIVVDDDGLVQADLEMEMLSSEPHDSTSSNPPESLEDFIRVLRHHNLGRPQKCTTSSLETYNSRTLSDAEIAGDPTQVRHLLSVLNDRKRFPGKVLIFHEDARPGYYGTWTRNSRVVGPRTPLERDVLARDYGYDSGEEWEDEGAGDADDVVDDGEEDDPDVEDADSDVDSWLVDDDEAEADSPLDPRDLSPSLLDLPMPPPLKRKTENSENQPEKKRKVVVPLVPYAKGPFWESTIGQCEYDPFEGYRIQLFNDTPYPINPFTFVSVAAEERQNIKAEPPFAVPSLPDKVQFHAGSASALPPPTVKRTGTILTPKTPFPDAHIGALLTKMTELATPSLTFLVESIYQDLRVHKVKKNAIEAKVREVGEKSRDKKIWVVKQVVQTFYGLA